MYYLSSTLLVGKIRQIYLRLEYSEKEQHLSILVGL